MMFKITDSKKGTFSYCLHCVIVHSVEEIIHEIFYIYTEVQIA